MNEVNLIFTQTRANTRDIFAHKNTVPKELLRYSVFNNNYYYYLRVCFLKL